MLDNSEIKKEQVEKLFDLLMLKKDNEKLTIYGLEK